LSYWCNSDIPPSFQADSPLRLEFKATIFLLHQNAGYP
jgi:hypothetical protein